MATVISNGHTPYGGVIPLKVDTSVKGNSFHQNVAKEHKKESFAIVYCPNCEEVRDKREGIGYGKEWPMKRALVHVICSKCIKKEQENE